MSYRTTSHCPCHAESEANRVVQLAIILAASYSPPFLPKRLLRTVSLLLERIADLRSYALRNHAVTHHWPTARTRSLSSLILLAQPQLLRVAGLASFSLTYCGPETDFKYLSP